MQLHLELFMHSLQHSQLRVECSKPELLLNWDAKLFPDDVSQLP